MLNEKIEEIGSYFIGLKSINSEYKSITIQSPQEWVYNPYESDSYNITIIIGENLSEVNFIGDKGCSFEMLCDFVLQQINNNLEMVEKNNLFQQTIEELKQLFLNNSLSTLKNINISVDPKRKKNNNRQNVKKQEVVVESENITETDVKTESELEELKTLLES